MAGNEAHQILWALTECQRVVLRARDEQQLAEGICKIVVEIAGYAMAWVGFAETDPEATVRPIAVAGIDGGYLTEARISHGEGPTGAGPTGTAIRTGQVQVGRDLRTLPTYNPWRAIALERGYQSSAAFPLIMDGHAFGALSVYAFELDAFSAEAVTLLGALSIDLAYGISTRRNLSARKRAERELAEGRRRLGRVLDRMSTFVALVSPAGEILELNNASVALSGLSADDVVERPARDLPPFLHPDASRAELIDALARAGRGEAVRLDLRVHVGDGQMAVLDTRFEPCIDAAGKVVEIVASGTDITERCRALDALRSSEQRFRALVDNALDLILVTGLDGVILDVSASVHAIGGYRPEDLVGGHLFDFAHPDDVATATVRLAELVGIPNSEVHVTLRFRHADGSYRTMQSVGRNLAHIPAIGGVLINARDITAQIEVERMLRQAEKLEAIGQLASGIAHDFNNLLTVVVGNVELMRKRPDASGLIEEVRLAALRAADLTSRLLAFSRRGPEHRHRVDVHDVLREVEALTARTVDRRISVAVQLEARDAVVIGDSTQLQGAVLNLAVNARDAMPEGGRLTLATRNVTIDEASAAAFLDPIPPGVYVEIAVTDTGSGIAPTVADHLFEPFFTTKSPGKGTGLGLPGVRNCARAHAGTVSFEPGVGHGATFRLLLPCAPAAVEVAARPPRAPLTGSGRILVIDDDDDVRRVISRALTSLGYTVEDCDDPDAAIALVSGAAIAHAAIVLDLNMPNRSGLDVLHAIRHVAPSLPVILCSGNAPDGVPADVFVGGHTSFVAKPFTIDDLAAAMSRMFGR